MPRKSILTLFGTRPEIIKLAPVLLQFERADLVRTINVTSGQHAELLYPLIDLFNTRIDYDLRLMTPNQNSHLLLHRIVHEVTDILRRECPDLVVVQGDTTTALAGAIAAHRCGVPVAHVEAGLRSGNLRSPYPEEINRISITRLAAIHFAATESNRSALRREGIPETAIFVTGNPIVDALKLVLNKKNKAFGPDLKTALAAPKCVVLTTHRRESFGPRLRRNFEVIRSFIEHHQDIVLVLPVHPNPHVKAPANEILAGHPRIVLTSPLCYVDFIHLLSKCWLAISDSGGVQEEVPSLGKPLLILREITERPECIAAGMARLTGSGPEALWTMLEEACQEDSWVNSVDRIANPFGDGDSARRIVKHCVDFLQGEANQCPLWRVSPVGDNFASHFAQLSS